MEYEKFLWEVQHLADLDTRERAEGATLATLETLAERLSGAETQQLCSQLPPELAQRLQQHQQEGHRGESFALEEFIRRVGDREQVELPAAANHVRLVFGVLAEAVTAAEMHQVRTLLPAEFQPLFEPVTQVK